MKLWDGWDDFLKVIASDHDLTVDQKVVFLVRFSRQSINGKRTNQDIANEVIGGESNTALSAYNKRMAQVFAQLSQSFPEINSKSKNKFERTQSCLEKAYLEQQNQKKSEASFHEIASHDWTQICRDMLESQKLNIRRQATEVVSKAFYVELGLVERKHQPRRSDDFSVSPEHGSGFFQLHEEEITQTYEHHEFLEQVIKQGQSKKSQGRRIAIIGEPGAGKTTLLEAIALSPKTPGFPIWVSLGSLRDKSLEEYLRQKWLKDALKTSDVTEQQKELENLFKSGEVLLLLDGVDEMPASSPVEALAKLREELTGWVADARTVLTCRQNVWDASVNALPGFDTYRTLDFSYGESHKPDQVRQLICEWFSKAEKPELGEPLREKLDEDRHQRIRDLVKNPLRLSLLCQSWYFHQGDLPETKAALYEQFTRAFYDWKQEQFSTTATKRKELNTALGLLAREAIDKEESRFAIRESFALDVMGEDLFKLATEKLHWLNFVYKDAETDEKVYAFFHPTFQEYFAACVIDDWDYFLPREHDNNNPKPVRNSYRIFEPQWKEIILLWLGRPEEEVPKQQKEDFIRALVEFEDGCWDFYRYLALFLAAAGIAEFRDCIGADWIVAKLVEYATEDDPPTGVDRVVNPAIWTTLLETDRTRVINVLIEALDRDFLDDDVRGKVFNSLMQIGTGNSKVIATLTKLMNTNIDDEKVPLEAAFFLGKINPDKREAVNFLKQQLWNTDLPDWVCLEAANFLGELDCGSPEAIDFLTDLIDRNQGLRLVTASTLGQISPRHPKAIKTLTKMLNREKGDIIVNIPLLAACNLLETDPENPDAIRVLKKFIKPSQKSWERLQAASALGRTQQYKQQAIKVICELISEISHLGKEPQLLQQSLEKLKQLDSSILYSLFDCQQENLARKGIVLNPNNVDAWVCILALLKHYMEKKSYLEKSYYEDIWHCALNMNYPDFHRAWHGRVYSTRTEVEEDITVIEFPTVTIVEN
ncbi:NACHT domain-containing protein [Cyanobacteria bacterium FACHB-472]|nr:NACHT domain-containing protein [Cyanobacteria bacterium FACHB-472]